MRFLRNGRRLAAAIIAWYRSLKKGQQIVLLVCCFHFFTIVWMSIDHCFDNQQKNHRPIMVRTLQPLSNPICHQQEAPQPIKKRNTPTVTAPKKTNANKTPVPAPKPMKKAAPKTMAQKPQPSIQKKKQSAPLKKEILEQIEESFENLSTPQESKKTIQPDIQTPAFVESTTKIILDLSETSSRQEIAPTYHLSLIDTLQNSLELPEMGEVVVKMCIEASGKISKIEIIETQSKKNAEWLKSQLPLLELPYFSDFGIVDNFLEFTIKFRNDEHSHLL